MSRLLVWARSGVDASLLLIAMASLGLGWWWLGGAAKSDAAGAHRSSVEMTVDSAGSVIVRSANLEMTWKELSQTGVQAIAATVSSPATLAVDRRVPVGVTLELQSRLARAGVNEIDVVIGRGETETRGGGRGD